MNWLHMQFESGFLLAFLIALAVVARVQPGDRSMPPYTKTHSSVTGVKPGLSPQTGQRFAWLNVPVWTGLTIENHEISRQIVNAIQRDQR